MEYSVRTAKFAELRAREAELERARADYLPKLSVNGTLCGVFCELDVLQPAGTTSYPNRSTWTVGLRLNWELFDGFIRDNLCERTSYVRRYPDHVCTDIGTVGAWAYGARARGHHRRSDPDYNDRKPD
jgi:hypothetical protein